MTLRVAGLSLAALLGTGTAFAQAAASPQGAPAQSSPAAAATPAAPVPPADPLPRANPKSFTAESPTVATVEAFLKHMWGYDTTRVWRVMGIQPTPAPNVSRVTVFVTQRAPNARVQAVTFFVTPDGKHAIGEGSLLVPFGADPFQPVHELLLAKANGPYRGAEDKAFEIVEFADLQCPHCKEAQSTVDQIVKDFPKAHLVFQLFPLVDIHPSAFKAASYGVCVQQKGNDAFFKYVDAVFDTQEKLTPATENDVLKAAADRAAVDGTAIAACAATQATKDAVDADIKLAQDAGIDATPTLVVNGRVLPLTGIPYEQLKQIIQYQATLDGVDSGATPETLAPKPPTPKLQDLPK